ncbi:MAG TPA: hypothetical protein VGI50_00635 [Solirubrobacteraceae bacterium]
MDEQEPCLGSLADFLTGASRRTRSTESVNRLASGARNEVMETIRLVLARSRDAHLDEPDVGQRFDDEAFCEAWLPLAHLDGTSEQVRALAWRAAGLIAERWGEGPAGHMEETVIGAAWGHATPPVGVIGATSLPSAKRGGEPSTDWDEA